MTAKDPYGQMKSITYIKGLRNQG